MGTTENREYSRWSTDMTVVVAWLLFPLVFVVGEEYANWAISQPWQAARISFGMLVLGAVSLLVSRLPLYRQGQIWTIGGQLLPSPARRWYRLAYWFILPNIVFLLLLRLTIG